MNKNSDKTKVQELFEILTVDFTGTSGKEAVGTCPFCGKEDKFYLNTEEGLFQCKSCDESGNRTHMIRHRYKQLVEDEQRQKEYRSHLNKHRGWSPLVQKDLGIVFDPRNKAYWMPCFNREGELYSVQFYRPDGELKKQILPGLSTGLFGLQRLSSPEEGKYLIIAEGFTDAVSVFSQLKKDKVAARYDNGTWNVIGVPSASGFKEGWAEHLKGREVYICGDNDKSGQALTDKVVDTVRKAKARCTLYRLDWPEEYPEKYDLDDLVTDREPLHTFVKEHSTKLTLRDCKFGEIRYGKRGKQREGSRFLWPPYIPLGEYVSMQGYQGTNKSTIAWGFAALVTAGAPFPRCTRSEIPPSGVLGLVSEDDISVCEDLIELAGGDLDYVSLYDQNDLPDDFSIEDPETIDELIEKVRGMCPKVALITVDAFNSFVGESYSMDNKARRKIGKQMRRLAHETGATVLGIRNESKDGNAMGAASFSDMARCVMRVEQRDAVCLKEYPKSKRDKIRHLCFEKLSLGRNDRKPLVYEIEDLSDPANPNTSYKRKAVCLEYEPIDPEDAAKAIAALDRKRGRPMVTR